MDRHAHAAKHRIPDSEFIIKDSYLDEYRYSDWFERAGLEMTFHSQHRPLERYSRALEQAGMVIEAIREHRVPDHVADKPAARRWQRLPLFMHIRAFKLAIQARKIKRHFLSSLEGAAPNQVENEPSVTLERAR